MEVEVGGGGWVEVEVEVEMGGQEYRSGPSASVETLCGSELMTWGIITRKSRPPPCPSCDVEAITVTRVEQM